ncbi:MAG: hypothetical protein E2P01_06535, partial [Acidobacteria bacterium]
TCFVDADQDGFGTTATTTAADGSCDTGQSESTVSTDCNDGAAAVNPGATETPDDGIDQDCNGTDTVTCFVDGDQDGFGSVSTTLASDGSCDTGQSESGISGDCNDASASIFPGATEIVDDGVDQDCNGADTITCFVDADQDGFGVTMTTLAADGSCDAAQSESNLSTDCDDSVAAVNPAAVELCSDGIDNDCNGLTDLLDLVPCGGPVTICSTLGDQPAGQDLDDDIFMIVGIQGEQIDVTLDVETTGEGRANLMITDMVMGQTTLFEVDASQLPNALSVQLPADGTYRIAVVEQSSAQIGSGSIFNGDYCLTVDSDGLAASTFMPSSTVESAMNEQSRPQTGGSPGTRPRDDARRNKLDRRSTNQRQSRSR